MKKDLNILFVGNSHTYFNDMPLKVQRRAADEGFYCRVTKTVQLIAIDPGVAFLTCFP